MSAEMEEQMDVQADSNSNASDRNLEMAEGASDAELSNDADNDRDSSVASEEDNSRPSENVQQGATMQLKAEDLWEMDAQPAGSISPTSDANGYQTEDDDEPTENADSPSQDDGSNNLSEKRRSASNGSKRYPCDFCEESFPNKQALKIHRSYHTTSRSFICEVCEMAFTRKIHLTDHMRTHTGERPYQCTECDKSYAVLSNLTKHRKSHETAKQFECRSCGAEFLTQEHLLKHQETHLKEREIELKRRIVSKTPPVKQYSPAGSMETQKQLIHDIISNDPVIKREVENVVKKQTGFKSSTIYSENDFAMSASYDMDAAPPLNASLGDQPTRNSTLTPSACKLCGKKFLYPCWLKKHMKKHGDVGSYECQYCGLVFPSSDQYVDHVMIHEKGTPISGEVAKNGMPVFNMADFPSNGNEMYKCSVCSETFLLSEFLKNHMEMHEREVKRHTCKICGMVFDFTVLLKKHKLSHAKNKSHACDVCKVRFKTSGELKRHSLIHLGPRIFKCGICGVRFYRKTHLKNHLRNHTRIRAYNCKICGKVFSVPSILKAHLMQHSGDKPYACAICNEQFPETQQLEAHLKEFHPRKETVAPILPSEEPIETPKLFTCSVCDKSFSTESALERHRVAHTENKPHQCECGASFAKVTLLVLHRLNHANTPHHGGSGAAAGGKESNPSSGVKQANESSSSGYDGSHSVAPQPLPAAKPGQTKKNQAKLKVDAIAEKLRKADAVKEASSSSNHFQPETSELSMASQGESQGSDESFESLDVTFGEGNNSSTGQIPEEECFECECGSKFTNSVHLKKHRKIHTGEQPYECGYCGERFVNVETLNAHKELHTTLDNPFTCDLCGKTFSCRRYLTKHRKRHEGKEVYRCNICHRGFVNWYELGRHMKDHKADDPDNVNFAPPEVIRVGYGSTTSKRKAKGNKIHFCDMCNAKFRDMEKLEAHRQKCSGSDPASLDGEDDTQESCEDPEDDLPVHFGDNSFAQGKNHTAKGSLGGEYGNFMPDIPIKTELPDEMTGGPICEFRPLTSSWGGEVAEIPKKRTRRKPVKLNPQVETLPEESEEDLEPAPTTMPRRRGKSKKFAAGYRPHECECGARFLRKFHLLTHLKTHMGPNPYPCEICGEKQTSALELKAHRLIHLTADEPYMCDICDKVFTCSRYLKNHKRRHAEQKPFKCELCHKSYVNSTELNIHKKAHMREEDTQYQWYVNPRKAVDNMNISQSGAEVRESVYICKICRAEFTHRDLVEKHLETHNIGGGKSKSLDFFGDELGADDFDDPGKETDSPLQCNVCEQMFPSVEEVEQHKAGSGCQSIYACGVCNAEFFQLEQLEEHIVQHVGSKEKTENVV